MKVLTKIKGLFFLTSIMILLSGCMAPDDEGVSKMTPYEDQIETMQKAVNAFMKNNGGLLPIKTRDFETDSYIKYPIEFSKLVPAYTEKLPANSYEMGGVFQYVLVDVENNPTVKLVDLRSAERIRELNLRKNINGRIPFKDPIAENVYEVDFKEMGFKEPLTVPSPYSDVLLPIVVGGDGMFYIDYSIDLNKVLKEMRPSIQEGEDIRYLLAEKYPVLPAYSLPYTVNEQNEPVFINRIPSE